MKEDSDGLMPVGPLDYKAQSGYRRDKKGAAAGLKVNWTSQWLWLSVCQRSALKESLMEELVKMCWHRWKGEMVYWKSANPTSG